MKKFFISFGIICGLISSANAGKFYGCSGPQIEYDLDSTWFTTERNHDLFCYVANNKWACFKSDSNYCADGTVVCILGSSNNGRFTFNGPKTGLATCRWAKNRINDTWEFTKPLINGDNYKNIDDCTNQKWKRNDQIEKNNAILVENNVAYKSANGYPTQFKVYSQSTYNTAPAHPNICVGYYCKGSDGKYTEPCDDGSCPDIGTECPDVPDPDPIDPDPIDPDPKDPTDPTDPSTDDPTAPQNTIHTNTIQPYLDALNKCAGK